MAECQSPPFLYGPANTASIKKCISDPRFNPFMLKAGFKSDELAFEFYLYNARLSKALLFPIHILEISLRNAINDLFSSRYTAAWWRNPDFEILLNNKSKIALGKAIASHRTSPSTDDLVASLTLDFWSNLFRTEYEPILWRANLNHLFPINTPTFDEIKNKIRDITHLRNRIAHHESILNLNIQDLIAKIYSVLELISTEAKAWVKAHSTVHVALRTSPSPKQEKNDLGSRCDSTFDKAQQSDRMQDIGLPTKRACIVLDENDAPTAIFDGRDLALFILAKSEDWCVLDFGAMTVADLISAIPATKDFTTARSTDSISTLSKSFKGATRYVIVQDPNSALVGFIERAHRQY